MLSDDLHYADGSGHLFRAPTQPQILKLSISLKHSSSNFLKVYIMVFFWGVLVCPSVPCDGMWGVCLYVCVLELDQLLLLVLYNGLWSLAVEAVCNIGNPVAFTSVHAPLSDLNLLQVTMLLCLLAQKCMCYCVMDLEAQVRLECTFHESSVMLCLCAHSSACLCEFACRSSCSITQYLHVSCSVRRRFGFALQAP